MNRDLVGEEAWDERYRNLQLEVAPAQDPVRIWIERFLTKDSGSCLELGCFPGRYLAAIAQFGLQVNGIDRTPRVVVDLPRWMEANGCTTGSFVQADVFEHTFERKYDLVCSFGLIEHFEDWPSLVRIHAHLVAEGGLLLLTTPNFRGSVQRRLHRWLDGDNLREHNLNAMLPEEWEKIVTPLGFETIFRGYFGKFDFWAGDLANPSIAQRVGRRIARNLKPLGRLLPEGPAAWTPYAGLAARKLPPPSDTSSRP